MRIDKNTTIRLGDRNIVKIKIGDSVIWQKDNIDYLYIENTYAGENTISVKQTITGSPDSSLYAKTLQYSKDKTNWTTITLSSTAYTITLNQGERVYLRGNEGVLNYYANDGAIQAVTNILGTQTHTIGGNINTLVNYITPNNLTLPQGVFARLFRNNTTITSAENLTLPATEMTPNCYIALFYGCTSLVNAPALPATILANNCYVDTFHGCSKLVNAPKLPATEMKPNCYMSLFYGCTSLVNPPKLPATKMATECYRQLFKNCSSLVNAPELPAKTLAEGCYQQLFYGCSKLNNVTIYANDISATNCTLKWLSNVASTGTFRNLGTATYPTGESGIPTGWTIVKN